MTSPAATNDALDLRYGDAPRVATDNPVLRQLVTHRSHRRFQDRAVDDSLVELVCAAALSVPSKSDLQQADIVIVRDRAIRDQLDDYMSEMAWLPAAPTLLVVCGNNRRQRQLHEWHEQEFANDHLDAFFNAATDAALLLGWLIVAAESEGLGTCPLSMIRNRADDVDALLGLPDHVFPYAGLVLGWPAHEGDITPRLPLSATIHVDRFDDRDIRGHIEAYDQRRSEIEVARTPGREGRTPRPWSYAKARQYARAQREGFGSYVRRIGFDLT